MLDRRRTRRNPLISALPAVNRDTGEKIGQVVDISQDGLMLVTGADVPVQNEYRLRLELPRSRFYQETAWECEATSLWSSAAAQSRLVNVGFRLHQITDRDRQLIESVVAEHGLDHAPAI
jgi:hypothetical protein